MEALHSIREALVARFEVLFETITRDNGTKFSRLLECNTTMAQRPDGVCEEKSVNRIFYDVCKC